MPSCSKVSLWGAWSRFGLLLAAMVFAADQAHKLWMLYGYKIGTRQPVEITPFFDLRLVWNQGISYGWLHGTGPYVLAGGQALVCLFLWVWLAGAKSRLAALATGIIIGGALGNIADRLHFGAVADFFHLHAFGYSWYVFNLADVAIVAGAAILVYISASEIRHKS